MAKEIGKQYDNLGNLIFEGEYLNGKKHWNGKEYEDGHLVFECEYKNDMAQEI